MNTEENNCILWTKALDSHGYGQSWKYGKPYKAHRSAYEEYYDVVLEPEQFLLHSCDTPACVNPLHLRIGTQAENMQDMHTKGRANSPARSRHYAAKLTEEQVKDIRNSQNTNVSLAERYNVSASNISYIKRGKRWK